MSGEPLGWRVTLRCGCVYRIGKPPDLATPYLCGVNDHGLVMVVSVERVQP